MAISYSIVLGWEQCEVDTASFWEIKPPQNQINKRKQTENTTLVKVLHAHERGVQRFVCVLCVWERERERELIIAPFPVAFDV